MSLLKKLKVACIGICLASALGLESKLYSKDIHIPKDYATIQAGIDAAEEGDRILVTPGEYVINESITYKGKNITLKSEAGPENTIIKMENPVDEWRASVCVFERGETRDTVLEGFTITGGTGTYCIDDRCGGGVFITNSSPTLKRNIIARNKAYWGGGIACYNNANPLILNCTIADNDALLHPGGIFIEMNSNPIIRNSILWNNTDFEGKEADIHSEYWGDDSYYFYLFRYSNLFYSLIGGEICNDEENCDNHLYNENKVIYNKTPLFIDLEAKNYNLQPNSPCIDAGDPNSPLDADGTRADMGALFYDQRIPFIRGDANRDKNYDISDPIATLFYLFGGLELKCLNAVDSNSDNKIDISDAAYSLNYLFLTGNSPNYPFPETGIYDAHGNLGCLEY